MAFFNFQYGGLS